MDLVRALQIGTLPAVYLDPENPERMLQAYVETYLKEEILQEALVRNIDRFVRFLDFAGQMNSEPVNHSRIGRSVGVTSKTVQEYFGILVDTLIAFRVEPWSYSIKKQLSQAPKYYLFDCGVLNAIRGELKTELKSGSFRFGKLFETFIVEELFRLNDYCEQGYKFYYWRTSTGTEVDLILSRGPSDIPKAIEIKSSPNPATEDIRHLQTFARDFPQAELLCISTSPHAYSLGEVKVYPWQEALQKLMRPSGPVPL